MLEKMKSWNWPVIWSVVTTLIWVLVTRIMLNAMGSPAFEAARNAPQITNDALYGFIMALSAGSVIASLVSAWRMLDKLLSLPCFAKKRKK